MTTRTASRRRQRRFPLVQGRGAVVELEHPQQPGRRHTLPIVDMSSSGVSFKVELQEIPAFEIGASLPQVTLVLGGCSIQGELVVMHFTPDSNSSAVCGSLFYPMSDADLVKLKSVIAGMEAIDTD
jgi:hypothetical protein